MAPPNTKNMKKKLVKKNLTQFLMTVDEAPNVQYGAKAWNKLGDHHQSSVNGQDRMRMEGVGSQMSQGSGFPNGNEIEKLVRIYLLFQFSLTSPS